MGATNLVHKKMMVMMMGGDVIVIAKQTDSERTATAISVANWPERWNWNRWRRCRAGTQDCML